jgi:hypothetical protein
MKTIKLQYPIENGKETITELQMRRPVSGDMRGLPIKLEQTDDFMTLAGRCCAQPPSVMSKLDFVDMMEVANAIGAFILPGRQTGEPG